MKPTLMPIPKIVTDPLRHASAAPAAPHAASPLAARPPATLLRSPSSLLQGRCPPTGVSQARCSTTPRWPCGITPVSLHLFSAWGCCRRSGLHIVLHIAGLPAADRAASARRVSAVIDMRYKRTRVSEAHRASLKNNVSLGCLSGTPPPSACTHPPACPRLHAALHACASHASRTSACCPPCRALPRRACIVPCMLCQASTKLTPEAMPSSGVRSQKQEHRGREVLRSRHHRPLTRGPAILPADSCPSRTTPPDTPPPPPLPTTTHAPCVLSAKLCVSAHTRTPSAVANLCPAAAVAAAGCPAARPVALLHAA